MSKRARDPRRDATAEEIVREMQDVFAADNAPLDPIDWSRTPNALRRRKRRELTLSEEEWAALQEEAHERCTSASVAAGMLFLESRDRHASQKKSSRRRK